MSIRKYFLGWDRPLLDLANDFLKKELSNKSGKTLVVVPSKQAARKLKFRFKENFTAKEEILFGTPESALEIFKQSELKYADQNQQLLAWAITLIKTNFEHLKNIFPIVPNDRSINWALRTARVFISLKNALREGGLNISDVSENKKWNFGDTSRWKELSRLEQCVESSLQKNGTSHKTIICSKPDNFVHQIKNIILIGLPDPPKILTQTLKKASSSIDIKIVIYAPKSIEDEFDCWGKPGKEIWKNNPINIPSADFVINQASTPKEEGQKVAEIINKYNNPIGLVGIIINDKEITASLRNELQKSNLSTYDPSGQSFSNHELYALLSLIRKLVATKSFRAVCEISQLPEIINIIAPPDKHHLENEKQSLINKILIKLDQINNIHMPKDLDAGLRFTANRNKYEDVNLALVEINNWINHFENDLNKYLPLFFEKIYSDREFDSYLDQDFTIFAKALISQLDQIERNNLQNIGPVDKLDLLIHSLKNERTPEIKEEHSIMLQGWLEALWDDNPHIIIAGMNEEFVPDKITGDIFLPESLRSIIGLRSNESMLARDSYIFKALLGWRISNGRIDITLGKTSIEGDNLRPSRLLLQCKDNELPNRALRLCSHSNDNNTIPPWTYAWELEPIEIDRQAKIFNQISVTEFRNYLSCPFRFYLKNIAGMNEKYTLKMEMDAREFGTLCHQVLDDFGKNTEINESQNADDIYSYLSEKLVLRVNRKYGKKPSVPILFQISSINERLRWFSSFQAEQRLLGWKICHSEYSIQEKEEIEIGSLKLRGTIDRIEINENDGSYRILDYKTTSHSKTPKSAHVKRANQSNIKKETEWKYVNLKDKYFEWVDLQLPLYLHATKNILKSNKISSGYFNIGSSRESTKIETWNELEDDFLESAINCARGVSSAICDYKFWPPNGSPNYDNYSEIIFGDCYSTFNSKIFSNI